ncbi:unnamed protein product [Danaus chrysippus]|uniref:(African queen) hypothetical protein n=1 Tax=Danaus chrysippus TaxID=151541 RepID=A0A8J2R3P5_9NEOP|nr:unnamed protein product [Danaus chrysippus]
MTAGHAVRRRAGSGTRSATRWLRRCDAPLHPSPLTLHPATLGHGPRMRLISPRTNGRVRLVVSFVASLTFSTALPFCAAGFLTALQRHVFFRQY